MDKLLEISGLSISFIQYYSGVKQRMITPVKNLNLSVKKGEIVAIVGASGSGKSLLAHAVLGVLPTNARVSYEMKYKGKNLDQKEIIKLRGKEIRYIPQSVQYLDPTMKIGHQLEIGFKNPKKEHIIDMLKKFSLPAEVYDYYPYELSGGMLRRVLFATCLSAEVELIIADEPTPGIHPEALNEILNQFRNFREQGISVIFITHDMKSAMEVADKIAIFKEGSVEAVATPEEIRSNDVNLNSYVNQLWMSQPCNKFLEAIK